MLATTMPTNYLLLSVAALHLVLVAAGPVCPQDTKRYWNQNIDKAVCCKDIQCDIGEQPEPCDLSSTTSSCHPCTEGTYQPQRRSLSDITARKCRMKTPCDSYIDNGTQYTDATCGCPPDKWPAGDGMCFPRRPCPRGYGQTTLDNCERCTEGKTYSDVISNTDNCKGVTNCETEGRCTLANATIESDSVCGPITTDLRLCQLTSKPTKSREPYDYSTRGPTKPDPTNIKTLSTDTNTIIICIVLAVCIVIAIFLIAFCVIRRRRRRQKKNLGLEALHLYYADKISKVADVQVRPIREKVFEIVQNSLASDAPDKWEKLGRDLLEGDFNEICLNIKQKDIPDSEKMREMLGEWRERCQTDGPDLKYIFQTMFGKKSRDYHFKSVIDDIKTVFGTTLGVPEKTKSHNSDNWHQCVKCLAVYLQCHKGVSCNCIDCFEILLGKTEEQDEVNAPISVENQQCPDDEPPSVLFEPQSNVHHVSSV